MPATPLSPAGEPSEEIRAVADGMVELMRAFTRARAQFIAAAAQDVEWSAQLVLKCLAGVGRPLRSGAIADLLQSDPSTVSRQVATLVKDGMLVRQADPDDGRACLLALTPKADEVLREQDHIRKEHYGRMLADWSEHDLRTFADLLRRFTDAFVSTKSAFVPGTAETQPAPAEGKAR